MVGGATTERTDQGWSEGGWSNRQLPDQSLCQSNVLSRNSLVPHALPLNERGLSYDQYYFAETNYIDFAASINSGIQGINPRIGTRCGEPNAAKNEDSVAYTRTYEQTNETAVLNCLEATARREERYAERRRRREVYLNGMNQETLLLVPRGNSQHIRYS